MEEDISTAATAAGGSGSSSGNHTDRGSSLSLEERLRRERQRLSSSGSSLTQFSWTWTTPNAATITAATASFSTVEEKQQDVLRLLVPARGSLYIQDGILNQNQHKPVVRCIHDKSLPGVASGAAIDPQLSPDGSMVAWTCEGELYVKSASTSKASIPAIQISFGAQQADDVAISHGVADFVSQEEIDRYRGFWWHPDSNAILFTRTDESNVPVYRIIHHDGDSVDFSAAASAAASYPSGKPKSGSKKSGTTSSSSSSSSHNTNGLAYEDHRYPFAGKENPKITLGVVQIDRESVLRHGEEPAESRDQDDAMHMASAQDIAMENWDACRWIDPPREAPEYLARVYWLPDASVVAQWQNRAQNVSVLFRIDLERAKGRTLLLERSDVWINLHHMFEVLPRAIHPDECTGGLERDMPPMPYPLPEESFSFLFASERSGFSHLYLYTYAPGINGEQAVLLKQITGGNWVVESITGVDMEKDVVYCAGTYDSPLERHLYAVPFLNNRISEEEQAEAASGDADNAGNPNGVRRGLSKVMHALSGGKAGKSGRINERSLPCLARPVRLTMENGMHSVVMDDHCRYFVDTSSDLARPTSVKIYEIPRQSPTFLAAGTPNGATNCEVLPVRLLMTLYDALLDDKSLPSLLAASGQSTLSQTDRLSKALPPPELISFPTADGSDTLHAALYRPDPVRHGPGPYPLVCGVYGGPHVQRVNRSWSQSADLRAQRLRSLGFCVVKCDNRGSSRRGMAFESAIAGRLGRLEVLDQVAVVRQLVVRGIADGARVGVYGWSYGGYLSAMCLCRAPDVFHVAIAGAPVTSWDGYDTHYTERYMGLPEDNPSGYRESAVFDHVPNMQGKLMIVHGLIDENVHFRHTARLINKLIASGKEYDLLIFPEERHSPRRLRDRIYMEQRISDFVVRHLGVNTSPTALDLLTSLGPSGLRTMAGHL